jgi:ATP-dependent helicase HrpA
MPEAGVRAVARPVGSRGAALPIQSAGNVPGNVAAKTVGNVANNAANNSAALTVNITSWSFGDLPELLEIEKGKLSLIGFPALVDKQTYCDLEVFDDQSLAQRTHRLGLRRLFTLQMKDQLKNLEKNIPGLQQLGMQFINLGSQEELRTQILNKAIELACMQEPLPQNEAGFIKRKDEGRGRLGLLVNEIARLLAQIMPEYHALPKKLQTVKAYPAAVADMQNQLQALIGKRFLIENDFAQLAHFPRYLKAMHVRIDKLRADPQRDVKLMAEWQQAANLYQRAAKEHTALLDPKMAEYRWLLEELRVSLYAQELRTPMPISVKRLQKVWESMQR